MSNSEDIFYRYWGKADTSDGDCPGYHLLPYHCLDVAAVGHVLLSRHQSLLQFFTSNSGLDFNTFNSWATYFLSLHDLGKFSESFQGLQEKIFTLLQQKNRKKEYEVRHDSLGFILWRSKIADSFCSFLLDSHEERQVDIDYWMDFSEVWARSFIGHHGQPPKYNNRPISRYFAQDDIEAANQFSLKCMDMFFKNPFFVEPWPIIEWLDRMRCLSWWMAGFAVLCDWLGSNRKYFKFCKDRMLLEEYWSGIALPSAENAVESIDISPIPASRGIPLTVLFENIRVATPLQGLSETIPMANGPQLFILEDVTGAGKTEAAFMLLHRMMASGLAEGAYIALPTMATANAMYSRTRNVYRQLYDATASPSLVLAHGARHLVNGFNESVIPENAAQDSNYTHDEATATGYCNAWLADNRKKAMLAHMGVGTIDQALLAILQSRYQSMRLIGLRGKVLIVDEVHASDAYMHHLLQTLLTFHVASGGSAILLSATLPKKMRQELQDAFSKGLRKIGPTIEDAGYPLLTQITEDGFQEKQIATRQEMERKLFFSLLHDPEQAIDMIVEKANGNSCVAWVRNTVADALDAYEKLINILPEYKVILFHARFTLGDRLEIEDKVLSIFGKNSKAEDRAGKVLVATQVIEQSLDLDFDWIISDLAPIDLLIQRGGRMRRHIRDKKGNPIDGKEDKRGKPHLYVLSPELTQKPGSKWFSNFFPKAVKVYEDHGRLWLTANFLSSRKFIRIPEDMRLAIEEIYGDKSEEKIPEDLLQRSLNANTDDLVQKSQARMNSIDFESGYMMPDHEWWDETVTPTRLGEPTVTLRLAKWENGELRPWVNAMKNSWSLSEVSVRQKKVKFEAKPNNPQLAEAIEKVKQKWPGYKKVFCILVPMVRTKEGHWIGEGLDGEKEPIELRYSARFGLQFD